MDPRDFMEVARQFKDSSHESFVRTSISRSYYSLFNCIKEFFVQKGVSVPQSGEAHRDLRDTLRSASIREARILATVLGSLWEERKKADYEMSHNITSTLANLCFNKAEKAVRNFDSFKNKLSLR